ncbi:Glucan endo-1,3-beta-glucosidase [Platanthera guangdongensis]|uniref:Glucan endo-1,3-beta-glucosidase n=1 Tax=Platanthera guangdongensis TaxID=2320717 RepID=A0ABR2LJV5_9ASPA
MAGTLTAHNFRPSIPSFILLAFSPSLPVSTPSASGNSLFITAPNGDIPSLSCLPGAYAWVAANISPFYPATNISLIAVGNEIKASGDRNLIVHLVPAIRSLSVALSAVGFPRIRVSTPHSLGILSASQPPSSSRFRRVYDRAIFAAA